MLTSLQVVNWIFIGLRYLWKYRSVYLSYVSTNFQLIIFYGGHMYGGFLNDCNLPWVFMFQMSIQTISSV